jgi:hypothetical protein
MSAEKNLKNKTQLTEDYKNLKLQIEKQSALDGNSTDLVSELDQKIHFLEKDKSHQWNKDVKEKEKTIYNGFNTRAEQVIKHHVKITMEKDVDKLINSMIISEFENEKKALELILKSLKGSKYEDFDETKWSNEIWKFYRAYLLKEFIAHYYKRIAMEKGAIDTTKKKTVQMMEHFFWAIPESNHEIDSKYHQRFISKDVSEIDILLVFKELKIIHQENICNMLKIKFPDSPAKQKLNKRLEGYKEKLKDKKIKAFLNKKNTEKIDKTLMASIADKSGKKIQLDHVIPRKDLKKFVEKVCESLTKIDRSCRNKEINTKIDSILPYLIGTLVTKGQNSKLSKKEDFKFENIAEEISRHYKKIKMLDSTKGYKEIKFDKTNPICKVPYNFVKIKGKEVKLKPDTP